MNDKVKHIIVGVGLGSISYFIGWKIGLGVSSVVFVGKEVWDIYKKNPTGFDWWDLAADLLGWVVGFVGMSLIFGV